MLKKLTRVDVLLRDLEALVAPRLELTSFELRLINRVVLGQVSCLVGVPVPVS